MLKEKDKEEGTMPTTAEVIETLARKLERARILNDLKECKTIEDYQELTKKIRNDVCRLSLIHI